MLDLGPGLRELLRRKGWTQQRLAKEMGVSRKSVVNWLSGSPPTLDHLLEALEKLGADFLDFHFAIKSAQRSDERDVVGIEAVQRAADQGIANIRTLVDRLEMKDNAPRSGEFGESRANGKRLSVRRED